MQKKAVLPLILRFLKKNAVMVIALLAAAVTCFFVPPDNDYLGYFDFKTLASLFSVLAVVCALKNAGFFYMLAQKVVAVFKTASGSILALVYVTFIGSMLIANDMALLTFLPLGFLVLSATDKKKYTAFTFVMQNIAANLGGMLTPFGNPQNLYLYSKFNIPTLDFLRVMSVPFALSIALITACCLIFVKPEKLEFNGEKAKCPPKRTALYLALFALAIIMIFRVIPYWAVPPVIIIALLFADRKALLAVDYPLLLTFVFFFVFAGNMGRIEGVRAFFSYLLGLNPLLFSVMSCQVISNVPSAVLLAQFTQNYVPVLIGVNIGGVGTLISSLASLITFREYCNRNAGGGKRFFALFSAFNFAFLLVLTCAMLPLWRVL